MAIEEGSIVKSNYHNVVGRAWGIELPPDEVNPATGPTRKELKDKGELKESGMKDSKSDKDTKSQEPPPPQRVNLTYLDERNEAVTIQTAMADLTEVSIPSGDMKTFGKFPGKNLPPKKEEKESEETTFRLGKEDEKFEDEKEKESHAVNPPHRPTTTRR